MRLLLEAGAEVDALDYKEATPLRLAIRCETQLCVDSELTETSYQGRSSNILFLMDNNRPKIMDYCYTCTDFLCLFTIHRLRSVS